MRTPVGDFSCHVPGPQAPKHVPPGTWEFSDKLLALKDTSFRGRTAHTGSPLFTPRMPFPTGENGLRSLISFGLRLGQQGWTTTPSRYIPSHEAKSALSPWL